MGGLVGATQPEPEERTADAAPILVRPAEVVAEFVPPLPLLPLLPLLLLLQSQQVPSIPVRSVPLLRCKPLLAATTALPSAVGCCWWLLPHSSYSAPSCTCGSHAD